MSDILNIGVAKTPKRKLNILSIKKTPVRVYNRDTEKLVLNTIEPSSGKKFNISDAWVEDTHGNKKVAGLWINLVDGEINKNSTLAKMLKFYEADVIGDLINKEIIAYPDDNNYLVICACNMG